MKRLYEELEMTGNPNTGKPEGAAQPQDFAQECAEELHRRFLFIHRKFMPEFAQVIREIYAKRQPPAGEHQRIYTLCPACNNSTLTLSDGHLLCTWHDCPCPTLIENPLKQPPAEGLEQWTERIEDNAVVVTSGSGHIYRFDRLPGRIVLYTNMVDEINAALRRARANLQLSAEAVEAIAKRYADVHEESVALGDWHPPLWKTILGAIVEATAFNGDHRLEQIALEAWEAVEHGLRYEGVHVGKDIILRACQKAVAKISHERNKALVDNAVLEHERNQLRAQLDEREQVRQAEKNAAWQRSKHNAQLLYEAEAEAERLKAQLAASAPPIGEEEWTVTVVDGLHFIMEGDQIVAACDSRPHEIARKHNAALHRARAGTAPSGWIALDPAQGGRAPTAEDANEFNEVVFRSSWGITKIDHWQNWRIDPCYELFFPLPKFEGESSC